MIPMLQKAPVATPPGVWAIGPSAASGPAYNGGKEVVESPREGAIPQETTHKHPAGANVA